MSEAAAKPEQNKMGVMPVKRLLITMSLPMISLEGNAPVIGTNTVDCMRSGLLYGHGGMLDNFIDRFQEQLGKSTVVVTGGFGPLIKDYCRNDFIIDKQLVLKGLKIIYDKNSKNLKK